MGEPVRSQDIEIPEPCHADWDAMRPEAKGRFCFDCQKRVHDLSAMTKDEAKDFLRRSACADICVSYEHHEDGTLVFREPEPRPAPVVPLSRLRRPRAVAAAVAGAGMAIALAACAPHGDAPVQQRHAAEEPVFSSPSVVIPHGTQETTQTVEVAPPPVAPPPVVEDEPCDPAVEKVEKVSPERPRMKGKVKRTAGKPMPPQRVKGDMAWVDPEAL